jgi:hypothetical protein
MKTQVTENPQVIAGGQGRKHNPLTLFQVQGFEGNIQGNGGTAEGKTIIKMEGLPGIPDKQIPLFSGPYFVFHKGSKNRIHLFSSDGWRVDFNFHQAATLPTQFSYFLQFFGVKKVPNIQDDQIPLFLTYYPLNIFRPNPAQHLGGRLDILFLDSNHPGNPVDDNPQLHPVNIQNDKAGQQFILFGIQYLFKVKTLMKVDYGDNFTSEVKDTLHIGGSVRDSPDTLNPDDLFYVHNIDTVKLFPKLKSNQLI